MVYFKRVSDGLNKTLLRQEAYSLLERVLSDKFGINSPEYEIGEFGKPYIRGANNPYFNISHCKGAVACAVSEFEIGVDVERIRTYNTALEKRVLSLSEQNYIDSSDNREECFFKFWTLKESYVKALGRGLGFSMKNVIFNISDSTIKCNQNNVVFGQHITENSFIISVCRFTTKHNI